MTIDKALNRLRGYLRWRKPELDDNFYESVQLGIEALKLIKRNRRYTPQPYNVKLPGETEETERR